MARACDCDGHGLTPHSPSVTRRQQCHLPFQALLSGGEREAQMIVGGTISRSILSFIQQTVPRVFILKFIRLYSSGRAVHMGVTSGRSSPVNPWRGRKKNEICLFFYMTARGRLL